MPSNSKIKVAILGSYPIYPYRKVIKFRRNRKNLVTSWNYNLAKALAKSKRVEVHFFCNAPLWKTKIYDDNGLKLHFVGHLPRLSLINRLTKLGYSSRIYKRLLNELKPDIVHGIGTDHEYAYLALNSGYPNIITVHGVMRNVIKKTHYPRNHIFHTYAYFEKISMTKAENVISINPYVDAQFPEFRGKFYPIENAINSNFFKIQTSESVDISFIGMYDMRKRLLNLIKALKIVKSIKPDLILNVIGTNRSAEYQLKIKSYIKENNLERNVNFLGQLEQNQVALELAKTKILVLPSIEETAPMVISEAMALGKPVVATDVGGIKYMIEHNKTGLIIEPDDINLLASSIQLLLMNKKMRESMGCESRKMAFKKYHSDVIARKTIDAYMDVLLK